MLLFKTVNPYLVSNFSDQQISGQHFMLCEAITNKENLNSQTFVPKASCHVVFFKSDFKNDKSLTEDTTDNYPGFYPLLPQYLPSENFSFHNFDQLSLAHSCEIYLCNQNNFKLENDSENIAFIPKNYFKFKELYPTEQDEKNLLSQDSGLGQNIYKQNLLPTFSGSFEENCDANLSISKDNQGKDLSEITNMTTLIESLSEYCETATQTEEFLIHFLKYTYFSEKFSEKIQDSELEKVEEVVIKSNITFDLESVPITKTQNNIQLYAIPNQSNQEQLLSETSLLDEIEALKDNLNQQNAVLLRLKEELEESNFMLAEKEHLLVILQLEHSRLNSLLTDNGIKEIEEKECQTEPSEIMHYETLKKKFMT
ncbi:uncharacterized protein CEXT_458671 [Caerostris extrusa]|uniref:Uncharacterized protein n=1 Tax=Caerostris extrusa TaxID=172846 RepID=A0AAV4MU98_CAEEX|nr:uncharacterized protein CEXT_458671 [Caerostris extrusa]